MTIFFRKLMGFEGRGREGKGREKKRQKPHFRFLMLCFSFHQISRVSSSLYQI